MQLPPSAALAHLIRHFLVVECDDVSYKKLRMFSDGNTGIVFNYQDPILYQELNKPREFLPPCFLYGPFHRYQDVTSTGRLGMLVAVFHPFAASSLLKIHAIELINKILGLETVYGKGAQLLIDQILHAPDVYAKIRAIESFLITRLSGCGPINAHAAHAVRLIQEQHGNIPTSILSSSLRISERKLQRVFENNIGYSPKRFSGITKVQYFLKLLRKNHPVPHTGLVYEAGFFDQAHLIRTMRGISGITPGEYISQSNLLAANFLEIPRSC